ncbi:hypothetical protein [Pseudochrobactrum asaccharolyticum]|uniref:Uncharacterized protein n=1 Tax=Pseudochrobactrum asaccharolyticum TaxID=354351 RepID=A0A366DKB1_9HYPH|nr:hypothetical protein [Pseudochrobactrum asaccharolyticum]RBO90513.1 hypothetical protein DFR47_11374 [Pseudochrobactrum asaccharolyticum]
MKKEYFANTTGMIEGAYRNKGDSCGMMTERAAKYPLMAGLITDKKPVAASAPVAEERNVPEKEIDPTLLGKKTR